MTGQPRPLWQKLLWFVALWGGGVLVVGTVAYLIRAMIMP
ncbi:DUF2474 family protein [Parvularcula sp. LCG005]|nr:DUF2474 family protein [Parvularcula sp. LCG005]WOI53195.1 DUF2474 family protein [Parvularcula sp. LCG005]